VTYPKLYLKYAGPLDEDRRALFLKKNLGFYPSPTEIKDVLQEWQETWNTINANDRVFHLLTSITGVTLTHDLEMYIFGTGLPAMSKPLMIPIIGKGDRKFTVNDFTELIIHELIHRFVGDVENNPGITSYWQQIRQEYSGESIKTQNHIIVYAVLEETISQLFDEESISSYINPPNQEYQVAVDIMRQKGRHALIQQFQSFLK
jgi:hypothetical protein